MKCKENFKRMEDKFLFLNSASPLTYKNELVAFAVSLGGTTYDCADE